MSLCFVAPSGKSGVAPEVYATTHGLHVCVLPETLRSLYVFANRFTTLIGPSPSSASTVVPSRSNIAASFPLSAARLRLSVCDVNVSLPGVSVPSADSIGVVLEASSEVYLEYSKEHSRLEVEVAKVTARRSAITQTEPSATLLRPFSLRMAAELSASSGELKGQAEIGELSVVLTYAVRNTTVLAC